ncbi:hypothetical protein [Pararhizobium gei]|uniref:hypothetical protein n=1 Tax=Pararhizobium gei TaxID=1395951 RepID=UPI0023DB56AE|nr:hypothetical protein [Rhizobium gei]
MDIAAFEPVAKPLIRFSLAQLRGACKEGGWAGSMLQSFKIPVMGCTASRGRGKEILQGPRRPGCAFCDTSCVIVFSVVRLNFRQVQVFSVGGKK